MHKDNKKRRLLSLTHSFVLAPGRTENLTLLLIPKAFIVKRRAELEKYYYFPARARTQSMASTTMHCTTTGLCTVLYTSSAWLLVLQCHGIAQTERTAGISREKRISPNYCFFVDLRVLSWVAWTIWKPYQAQLHCTPYAEWCCCSCFIYRCLRPTSTLKSPAMKANHIQLLLCLVLQKVPNSALYARCSSKSISHVMKISRWKLFGHILYLPEHTPAGMSNVWALISTHKKAAGEGAHAQRYSPSCIGTFAGQDRTGLSLSWTCSRLPCRRPLYGMSNLVDYVASSIIDIAAEMHKNNKT